MPKIVFSMSFSGVVMNQKVESSELISASKVTGTDVYGATGERIGEVDDLVIYKISGEVIYAVMSFGGFLGIGEKLHPIPLRCFAI
jgi:hypothetical protein